MLSLQRQSYTNMTSEPGFACHTLERLQGLFLHHRFSESAMTPIPPQSTSISLAKLGSVVARSNVENEMLRDVMERWWDCIS